MGGRCDTALRGILVIRGNNFSSPGRSPGKAIVLPPVSALAFAAGATLANFKVFTLNFFM